MILISFIDFFCLSLWLNAEKIKKSEQFEKQKKKNYIFGGVHLRIQI